MLELNREHAASREGDQRLDSRIRSYELAAKMQLAAPEALNLKAEPEHMLKHYGLDRGVQTWPKEINDAEETYYFFAAVPRRASVAGAWRSLRAGVER
jgi:hypothetical protein